MHNIEPYTQYNLWKTYIWEYVSIAMLIIMQYFLYALKFIKIIVYNFIQMRYNNTSTLLNGDIFVISKDM